MSTDTRFVRGADKLQKRIASIRASLDLPSMVEEVQGLLLARTLRRFDAEVDPDGKAWKDLAPATVKDKLRKGGGKKKLVKTKEMRDSIKAIRGGIGTLSTNTGAQGRIGINDPAVVTRARVHQKGYKKIPARRFLGIGALDIKAVDSLLRRKAKTLGL